MGMCTRHPERETRFQCLKHGTWMCEECLSCRDPQIYCKNRSACPIWFIEKRRKRIQREEQAAAAQTRFRVAFEPDGGAVAMPVGSTLLEAAQAAGIHLNASCNGKGLSGKCKLLVDSGKIESEPTTLLSDAEKQKRYVLACQSRVTGDAVVRIPEETLERKLKVAGMGREATERLQGLVVGIEPMLREIPLELSPPTLEDAVSDLDRLNRGLKKEGCGRLRHARTGQLRGRRYCSGPALRRAASRGAAAGEDIVFTASDLKNLIFSKGAVYAGFTTLLKEAGLDFSLVEQVLISGGFGQYLDIEKAVRNGTGEKNDKGGRRNGP